MYKFLEIKEIDWFRMTKEQRQKHMQKIANVQFAFTGEVPGDNVSSEGMLCTATQLPIRPEDFQSGLKVPPGHMEKGRRSTK